MHIDSSTPQPPKSSLFPPILLCIYSIFPDFIRNGISQSIPDPKAPQPGTGELKSTTINIKNTHTSQPHPKFLNQGAASWTSSCLGGHSSIQAQNSSANPRKKPLNSPGRGDPWHCSQSGSHLAMTPHSTGHGSAPVANIGFSAAVAERKEGGKYNFNSYNQHNSTLRSLRMESIKRHQSNFYKGGSTFPTSFLQQEKPWRKDRERFPKKRQSQVFKRRTERFSQKTPSAKE